MIHLQNVSKSYLVRNNLQTVLNGIDLIVQSGEKVGILGRNGSGKSTLIRLISGAIRPDRGKIKRNMTVSWPLAFSDAFQGNQTGLDCLRFVCRIYGIAKAVIDKKVAFVQDFAELGIYLYEPIKSYSSGMRARLSFAISMVVEFDCFLIDEVVAVGDSRFHQKCYEELFIKRGDRAFIIVSHDPTYIKTHCEKAAVLIKGRLHSFDNTDEAYDFYLSGQENRLKPEEIVAAYRFILGREPENQFIIEHYSACETLDDLRKILLLSNEFTTQGLLSPIERGLSHNLMVEDNLILHEQDIIFAYQFLLGRAPSLDEAKKLEQSKIEFSHLRKNLLNSDEFKQAFKKLHFC